MGQLRATRHDAATDLRGRTPFARLHAFDLLPAALGEERENDVHKNGQLSTVRVV